jgi:hypothetical protein
MTSVPLVRPTIGVELEMAGDSDLEEAQPYNLE